MSVISISYWKKVLKNPKSRGLLGLYFGRTTLSVSSGLLGIFLPIFFYNIFNQNFIYVVLYYLFGYLAYGLFSALGAQFLNKFGFKKALISTAIWGALFYALLFFAKEGGSNLVLLISLSFLALLMFRLSFWLPYNVDFAKFTNKDNRGKQISIILATFTILNVIGPILAGYVIQNFGFNALFIIAVSFFIFAIVPFSIVPKTNEKFIWGYCETWKNILDKKNRSTVLSLMASGAENMIGVVVWPIFIFLLLNGDYLKVGAVSSFIIGGTIIVQLVTGKYIDGMTQKSKMLKWGSALYSVGWVAKIFVLSAFSIFVVGLYHSLTSIFMRTSFNTMFYEIAADQGHYIDEFTVLRETSIQIGRVIASVVVIFVSLYIPIQWTFLLAAFATILLNALYFRSS